MRVLEREREREREKPETKMKELSGWGRVRVNESETGNKKWKIKEKKEKEAGRMFPGIKSNCLIGFHNYITQRFRDIPTKMNKTAEKTGPKLDILLGRG